MLKIKHANLFHLPQAHMALHHRVQLSEVKDDNDELTAAIASDSQEHDDEWTLNERPDSQALSQFWNEVEEDISHDPEWQKISESDA